MQPSRAAPSRPAAWATPCLAAASCAQPSSAGLRAGPCPRRCAGRHASTGGEAQGVHPVCPLPCFVSRAFCVQAPPGRHLPAHAPCPSHALTSWPIRAAAGGVTAGAPLEAGTSPPHHMTYFTPTPPTCSLRATAAAAWAMMPLSRVMLKPGRKGLRGGGEGGGEEGVGASRFARAHLNHTSTGFSSCRMAGVK